MVLKDGGKKFNRIQVTVEKKGPSHNYAWVCPITLTLKDDKGKTSTDTAYFGVLSMLIVVQTPVFLLATDTAFDLNKLF